MSRWPRVPRMPGALTLVACGAPLAAQAGDIAAAAVAAGWDVVVVASPAGAEWLDAAAIERTTGRPLAVRQRGVDEPRTAPMPDVVAAVPVTFNTANKVANGISDTYAAGVLCEAIAGRTPLLMVATISTRLWGHPAVARSLETLTDCGVTFLDPTSGMPYEPRPLEPGGEFVAGFDPGWIVDAAEGAYR